MSAEEWRPVAEFPGYEVSTLGRVRSPRGLMRTYQNPQRGGHLNVRLSRDGRKHYRSVHRLVLGAFVGPRPEGDVSRHLNGDPTDNQLTNLAYGSQSENMYDAVSHGTHHHGSKTHCLNGHEFTADNTYAKRGGGRNCVVCAKRRASDFKARLRAAA